MFSPDKQVHGGTSEQDIINAVNETVKLAKENFKVNKKLYTMLFFDEANTTENIGLIKEIMCDRRLKGKPISDNVKFIAACNPYRKLVYSISKQPSCGKRVCPKGKVIGCNNNLLEGDTLFTA